MERTPHSQFDIIIEQIKNFREKNIPTMIAKHEREVSSHKFLKSLIDTIELKLDNIHEFDNWNIIAIDGGSADSNLEGIGFAVASAEAFTLLNSNSTNTENFSDFKFFTKPNIDQSELITSIQMKALEAKIAYNSLSSLLDKHPEDSFIVLFDGAFSFPDDEMGKANTAPDLKSAYLEYINHIDQYFELASTHNVFSIAIAKDTRGGKYLKGLTREEALFDTFASKDQAKIHKTIKNERHKERIYFQPLFRANNQPISFLKPVNLNKKGILKGNMPINYLKDNDYFGSYYFMNGSNYAYYFEFSKNVLDNFETIIEILYHLGRISPIFGYPLPLVYADRLTKMSKSFSNKIFTEIIIDIKTLAKDSNIQDMIQHKMRRSLNS